MVMRCNATLNGHLTIPTTACSYLFSLEGTLSEHQLDSMICSTHLDKYTLANDRHIAIADHFVFIWVSVLLCGTLE